MIPHLPNSWSRKALGVFEEGARRHYYTQSDIGPILIYLKQHLPTKLSQMWRSCEVRRGSSKTFKRR